MSDSRHSFFATTGRAFAHIGMNGADVFAVIPINTAGPNRKNTPINDRGKCQNEIVPNQLHSDTPVAATAEKAEKNEKRRFLNRPLNAGERYPNTIS